MSISIEAIFGGSVAVITTFLNWISSRQYREAKDAEFSAKEAGYTSQLAIKDEHISLLELVTDPDYQNKVTRMIEQKDRVIENQQGIIQELQNNNEKLKQEKEELISANNELVNVIPTSEMPDKFRNYLSDFVTYSNQTLENISGTIDAYYSLEDRLKENIEEIGQVTVLEVKSIKHGHVVGSPTLSVSDGEEKEA